MSFNPFDLSGSDFLIFYALFSLLVCVLLRGVQNRYELGTVPPGVWPETDPYKIACLRGHHDAIKVAAISLLERGLLEIQDGRLCSTDPDGGGKVQHPLERAILDVYASQEPGEVTRLHSDAAISREVGKIVDALRAKRFLPDRQIERFRRRTGWLAFALLWAVAISKILVAFSHGHHNVVVLILIAIAASIAALIIGFRNHTDLGASALRDAQERLSGLRASSRSQHWDGKTDDIVFLAAAFDTSDLPHDIADRFKALENTHTRCSGHGDGARSAHANAT